MLIKWFDYMEHNDDSILKIPGLLSKYKNSDLITAYKARFILYFCISCIIAIVTITFYSAYIQIHEPGIRFLDYSILGVELVILLLFILILILLVKGYFTFSANMLIISGITGTWIIIFLDKLHYLAKLDSIVFIFVIVTMTPLVVKRRSFVLVLYSLCNIPALLVLFHIQREQLDIPFNIKLDYIADVSIALLILAVILWNIFYINRTALEKLENDVKVKAEAEKILLQNKDEISRLLRFQNEMLESATVWINTLDTNGNVIIWNKAAEKISGFSKEEVIGNSNIWEWLYPDQQYRESINAKAFEIIKSELRIEDFQTTIKCKNGDHRIISWYSNNLSDDCGMPVGSIAMGIDITDQKHQQDEKLKLENQIIQLQKMESIGRLAGGIAHDFNNLLTAILGTTELALMKLNNSSDYYQSFITIKKASESAANLTRQLLLFSRKQTAELKIINLNELMNNTGSMISRLIGENIELIIRPHDNLCNINADPAQIEQIFINLSVNARDAMPEGGTLAIETSMIYLDDDYCRLHPQLTPGNYVMLSLSDTGTGMSKEIQEHIFEPFFTTKETGKGTGLGLATVYGAVKQNNGAIEVYSEVHHGTTFKIFFPCVEDTISVSDSKNFYFPEGNETILVVEDNTHVIEFVHDILKRLGYNILSSLNGQEALKQSEDYDGIIHLLLTDVILPGMNGKILAEQIKKLRPDIKILFNSGYTGDIISRSGIIEEGFHFISKPFSAHELSHKIRAILDK